MNIIEVLEKEQLKDNVPDFAPGDTVRVHAKIVEGNRERIQVFEGVVLKRQGGGNRETFTVRKLSFGVGVERTFPVHSPKIDKIEVVRRGDVRREVGGVERRIASGEFVSEEVVSVSDERLERDHQPRFAVSSRS